MPEMTFTVRWPDGRVDDCYSPSLVMHDHLSVGETYPLAEFVDRTSTALRLASERVRATYGFECTSAMQQRSEIEERAAAFGGAPDASVTVLRLEPPLGVTS